MMLFEVKGLSSALHSLQSLPRRPACCPATELHAFGFQAGEKPSFMDKMKAFGVKAIDHTQSALEGAKQNVRPLEFLQICITRSARLS